MKKEKKKKEDHYTPVHADAIEVDTITESTPATETTTKKAVPYAAIHAQYQPVQVDAIEVDSTPAAEIAANERQQRARANRGKNILYQAR